MCMFMRVTSLRNCHGLDRILFYFLNLTPYYPGSVKVRLNNYFSFEISDTLAT